MSRFGISSGGSGIWLAALPGVLSCFFHDGGNVVFPFGEGSGHGFYVFGQVVVAVDARNGVVHHDLDDVARGVLLFAHGGLEIAPEIMRTPIGEEGYIVFLDAAYPV